MFKKVLITLIVALAVCTSVFAWSGGYTMECVGCKQYYAKTRVGCRKCYAWRMYELEGKKGKYDGYMVYHCQHGHTLLVPYGTNHKTRDISEVTVLPKTAKK